jgi:RimJ/RimL family protein N-acetyltransferase
MSKPFVQPLEGEITCLRLLEESDLEMTLGWRNRDDIRKWFITQNIISPERHKNWFSNYKNKVDDFIFVIESKAHENSPVGQVSLYNIDYQLRKGEFGRLMIGESLAAGKGLAKEATRLIIQYAFEILQLDEVYLSVLAENERAIQLYKSCGFFVQSKDETMIQMSIKNPKRTDASHNKII